MQMRLLPQRCTCGKGEWPQSGGLHAQIVLSNDVFQVLQGAAHLMPLLLLPQQLQGSARWKLMQTAVQGSYWLKLLQACILAHEVTGVGF